MYALSCEFSIYSVFYQYAGGLKVGQFEKVFTLTQVDSSHVIYFPVYSKSFPTVDAGLFFLYERHKTLAEEVKSLGEEVVYNHQLFLLVKKFVFHVQVIDKIECVFS